MDVFLTGATGFVGAGVCNALLATGYRVVALIRKPQDAAALKAQGCEVIVGDMREPAGWQSAAAACSAAIHAAQHSMGFPITPAGVAQTAAADEIASEALLAAAAQGNLTRILYTSGLWSYGDAGDEWIDETRPYQPAGVDLRRTEREARLFAAARERGLTICSLILGNVYGPGASFRGYAERAGRGEHRYIGGGANYMSPIHYEDVGAAYVQALRLGRPGERYNICDDQPLRARDHAAALCAAAGGPAPDSLDPAEALKILGPLHTRSLQQSIRMSNRKARSELAWRPAYAAFERGVVSAIASMA